MRQWPSDAEAVKDVSLKRDVVARVWRFARPYRTKILAYLATIIAGSGAAIVAPLVVRTLLNDAIPERDLGWVNLLAIALVLAALGEAILSLLGRWLSASVGESLIFDLRVALYDHVQRMPVAFFTNSQTGTLISRLNSDVVGAQSAVTGTLGTVVSNVFTLAFTFTAMVLMEWRLTLLALVILPLFIIPSRRVGKQLQKLTRQSMIHNGVMSTQMSERFGVAGALLVTLFGRHDDETANFSDRAGQVRDIGIRSAIYGRLFMLGLGVVAALGTAGVYWVGSRMVIDGDLSPGDLVAMGLLVGRIYQPLTALTNARVDVLTAFVSFDRVFEVLDTSNPIVDREGAVALERPAGALEFDDVRFAYPAAHTTTLRSLAADGALSRHSETVLKNVSFSAKAGELIAVVGPSGAGKSTLVSLVSRLYDVNDGAIRIDGVDVRDVTLDSLRGAIGVVSQDPHLFHDSIGANLAYARPGASQDEIAEACRAAQILDVIRALPDGFDTIVGERGYRLSGGEKQRLAIARMLLKDPAIVILDEATSHLDSENEAAIQLALERALHGRTALVIAHRLSTIVDADRILVVDDGRIVESGTHGELMAANNLYAELYHTLVRDQESVTQR